MTRSTSSPRSIVGRAGGRQPSGGGFYLDADFGDITEGADMPGGELGAILIGGAATTAMQAADWSVARLAERAVDVRSRIAQASGFRHALQRRRYEAELRVLEALLQAAEEMGVDEMRQVMRQNDQGTPPGWAP